MGVMEVNILVNVKPILLETSPMGWLMQDYMGVSVKTFMQSCLFGQGGSSGSYNK